MPHLRVAKIRLFDHTSGAAERRRICTQQVDAEAVQNLWLRCKFFSVPGRDSRAATQFLSFPGLFKWRTGTDFLKCGLEPKDQAQQKRHESTVQDSFAKPKLKARYKTL